ncbi:hypothetical protein PanWU01x14_099330, partial [Parasponia andersonii]
DKEIDIETDIFFSLLPKRKEKTTDLSIGESLQVATPASPILLGVQRVLRQQGHVNSWRIQHQQFKTRGRLVRNRSNTYDFYSSNKGFGLRAAVRKINYKLKIPIRSHLD